MLQLLPAWLTSFVTHLLLFIAVGLLGVAGRGLGDSGNGMGVALDPGGSLGEDGSDERLGDPASELTEAVPPDVEPHAALGAAIPLPADALADALANVAESALQTSAQVAEVNSQLNAPLVMPNGAGPGSGKGVGRGRGEGVGDGEDEESGSGILPARTQIFGLSEEGTRFLYVFDRSESMNSTLTYSSEGTTVFSVTPLEAAKAELLRSLEDLGPRHRFQIVFYNHEPRIFDLSSANARLLAASKENKRRAARFIGEMYGAGGTYHLEPLEIALKMRPDVVFLLTDGEPKDDPAPYQIEYLTRLNKARAKINVIQFCFLPRSDSTLIQLAKQNRGQHLFFQLSRLGPGLPGTAAGANRQRASTSP